MSAAQPLLTRAELRRRAQGSPASAPLTRRGARVLVNDPLADAELPEVPVEALEVPAIPVLPVVLETAASALATSPIALPTSPIDLPVVPSRRTRRQVEPTAASPAEVAAPVVAEPDDAAAPLALVEAADETPDAAAPVAAPNEDERVLDAFEAAAALFAFTAETPVQVAATALAGDPDATRIAPEPTGRARRIRFKQVAAASFSVGVMGVIGLLTVGMTVPAEAVAAAKNTVGTSTNLLASSTLADTADEDIQAYVAPAQVQNDLVTRSDNFNTTTLAEIAADSGITNFSGLFVNDPTAAIQWPFAVGVPITYGFGMRSGRMHEGADFVPGAGAPVQAVADGTVRIATESGGAFGVTVLIDHVIDGELVSSRYGHMQYDSLQVKQGQQVTVGTVLGRTGNTGRSFGAHTHFEILLGGTTPVDPITWLREHTSG